MSPKLALGLLVMIALGLGLAYLKPSASPTLYRLCAEHFGTSFQGDPEETVEGVRAMSDPAVKKLVSWIISGRPTEVSNWYHHFWRDKSEWQVNLPIPRLQLMEVGWSMLEELRPPARKLMPLVKARLRNPRDLAQMEAAAVLAMAGDDFEQVVPEFTRWLQSTNRILVFHATAGLKHSGLAATSALPALIAALTNRSIGGLGVNALTILANLGTAAATATNILDSMLAEEIETEKSLGTRILLLKLTLDILHGNTNAAIDLSAHSGDQKLWHDLLHEISQSDSFSRAALPPMRELDSGWGRLATGLDRHASRGSNTGRVD